MSDIIVWVGSILGILSLTLLWQFKGNAVNIFQYFKNNLGITKGIVIFTGAAILIALLSLWIPKALAGDKFTYFNYGEVYVGLDHTKKLSPQCEEDGEYSNKLTSNGGIRINLLSTVSRRVEVNALYIHHSCMLNKDREQYDAFGLQATWKLWGN